MESNLSFFSLPFVDNADVDFSKIKGQECDYDDLHPTLPSHGSLLGADDVLAQFLSGDEPLEEPDLNGPTTLHCEICRKQFDNAKKYYGHLRVHSKDNLWICDICPNEKFSTKQQLMKHSLTHKPLERVWRCPQCDMSFEALWRLQQHLFAKHLDYRPHKCDRCEMLFHKLSDLKKHMDIHNDIKKHICTVCQMRFSDSSNLKRHMICHGKEKPYPCPGCGNRYTQIASMKRHSRNCAMVKPDTEIVDKTIRKNYCRVCGMTFKYKSAMLEHCVRQHSNNPPPAAPSEIKKEDKSNELHVDTNPIKIDTSRPVHIDSKHPEHIEIKHPININTNHPFNINIENNRLVNIDTNRLVNIETNHLVNLETNRFVNIETNGLLNIEPNRLVNIETNGLANIETNRLVNIETNGLVNIETNRLVNIETNGLVNIETNRLVNIETNGLVNIETNRPLNIDTDRPLNIDTNRTVDNIVDDILSAEDDYLIRNPMSTQMLSYNPPETENPDNLMQIELLKDMNHMHILDDELLYNDLDFDSFQTMCNTNDMDYTDRNELLFDIAEGRSIDQDIMNALYQVKGENLPDDLLNETEILNTNEKVNDFLVNPSVSVNQCATIFESDVDLEASTNLAANLNQLIGENSVQYISTEHDDTFIISLNSEIDAEQLTDMLNIGVGPADESYKTTVKETNKENTSSAPSIAVTIENKSISICTNESGIQPVLVKVDTSTNKENIANVVEVEQPKVVKKRKRVKYFCRKCNKVFDRKDNYKSHRATHNPSLRFHKCRVCGERFGYKSTLNKHIKKQHMPFVAASHQCQQCEKSYQAAWMLKRHMAHDHELLLPFACEEKDCGKKFYKEYELNLHKRFHTNERPYKCDICQRGFHMVSHLNRHVRKVDCTKYVEKADFTIR